MQVVQGRQGLPRDGLYRGQRQAQRCAAAAARRHVRQVIPQKVERRTHVPAAFAAVLKGVPQPHDVAIRRLRLLSARQSEVAHLPDSSLVAAGIRRFDYLQRDFAEGLSPDHTTLHARASDKEPNRHLGSLGYAFQQQVLDRRFPTCAYIRLLCIVAPLLKRAPVACHMTGLPLPLHPTCRKWHESSTFNAISRKKSQKAPSLVYP